MAVVATALHFPIKPMKAVLADLPTDDANWAYEIKWDGYRTLAFIGDGALRLQSSSGRDVTAAYPELAGLAGAINAGSAILDGELVGLDDQGKPRFDLIQRHERTAAFYAFDLLAVNGEATISAGYEQRRALLANLVEPGAHWSVPAHHVGGGADLFAAAGAQELEGVMAKRLGSPYQPGKRSPNWRKIKVRRKVTVIIGGFTSGSGNRSNTFGALLVGQIDEAGRLQFAGGVGTGFNQATLEALTQQLGDLATSSCPFVTQPPRAYLPATWVRPELQAELEIAEFTNDGYVRHATYLRLVSPAVR